MIQCPGLGKPLDAVDGFEPLHNGLFDDALAVGDGEELGIEAVALDGKRPVGGNDRLPGQGLGGLEEFVEAPGLKAADPCRSRRLPGSRPFLRSGAGSSYSGR